jgi:hypothetical protein
MGSGLIGFLMVLLRVPLLWSFAPLVVAAIVPIVYSFVLSKQLERRGEI